MLMLEALIVVRDRLGAVLPALLQGGGGCLMAFATASLLINQAAPIWEGEQLQEGNLPRTVVLCPISV